MTPPPIPAEIVEKACLAYIANVRADRGTTQTEDITAALTAAGLPALISRVEGLEKALREVIRVADHGTPIRIVVELGEAIDLARRALEDKP